MTTTTHRLFIEETVNGTTGAGTTEIFDPTPEQMAELGWIRGSVVSVDEIKRPNGHPAQAAEALADPNDAGDPDESIAEALSKAADRATPGPTVAFLDPGVSVVGQVVKPCDIDHGGGSVSVNCPKCFAWHNRHAKPTGESVRMPRPGRSLRDEITRRARSAAEKREAQRRAETCRSCGGWRPTSGSGGSINEPSDRELIEAMIAVLDERLGDT
jgi:hypothetical protein